MQLLVFAGGAGANWWLRSCVFILGNHMIRWRRIRWNWVFGVIFVGLMAFGYTQSGSRVFMRVAWISVVVAPVLVIAGRALQGVHVSFWNVATYTLAGYATVAILDSHHGWLMKVFLSVVIVMPAQSIANAVDRADRRHAQQKIDLAATMLNDSVAGGAAEVGRYAVYLRPFASTDRLEAQPQCGEFPTHLDLEIILTRTLRKDCPLVTLGRQGELLQAAGRITVADNEWQNTVVRLSERAAMLVIIPSAHSGTLWELKRLAEDSLLARTLLIMPEQAGQTPSGVAAFVEKDRLFDSGITIYDSSKHTYDIAGDWTKARQEAEAFGVHLPAYSPAGALFTLDAASGNLNRIAPLALSVLTMRGTYLRNALIHLGLMPWRPPRKTSLADDFEAATFGGGRTLEYALVVGAGAFLSWGRVAEGTDFLRRAISVCRRPRYSVEFAKSAALFGLECVKTGDSARGRNYLESIEQLQNELGCNPEIRETLAQAREKSSGAIAAAGAP